MPCITGILWVDFPSQNVSNAEITSWFRSQSVSNSESVFMALRLHDDPAYAYSWLDLLCMRKRLSGNSNYRQNSNICPTLICNEFLDHPNVVGLSALLQLHLHSRLNTGLQWIPQNNCKTRRETSKFWDFVPLILGIWRVSNEHGLHPIWQVCCFRISKKQLR